MGIRLNIGRKTIVQITLLVLYLTSIACNREILKLQECVDDDVIADAAVDTDGGIDTETKTDTNIHIDTDADEVSDRGATVTTDADNDSTTIKNAEIDTFYAPDKVEDSDKITNAQTVEVDNTFQNDDTETLDTERGSDSDTRARGSERRYWGKGRPYRGSVTSRT